MTNEHRLRRILAAALALCAPGTAAAHGQEIVFLPMGQALALVVVVAAALVVRVGWATRFLALVIAVAVGLPPWFVGAAWVPYWIAFSETAWFAVGLVPPVAFSGAFLAWRRLGRERARAPRSGVEG